jgi:hypothetical protein
VKAKCTSSDDGNDSGLDNVCSNSFTATSLTLESALDEAMSLECVISEETNDWIVSPSILIKGEKQRLSFCDRDILFGKSFQQRNSKLFEPA